ncbi:MAG: hypothetical protein V4622_11155 [Bacteroidota bacterium]
MLKFVKTIFFSISFSFIFAQGWQAVGARSMSLSNASVCLSDVWAFHHNPAALANLEKTSVGISYENRYLLKELQAQGFVYAQAMKKGVLSFGGQLYGHSLYRSTRVGMGYSMQLSENISAGVQLNYQSLRISNYGQKGTLSGEFGMLAKIKVKVGFSVFNLNNAKLSDFQDDRFSTYLRLGLSYAISSKVLLLAEAEKQVESKLRPKGALEYQMSDKFFLRVGAAGNPLELTFGSGFAFDNGFKLDFGTAWHQLLGWSPHVGLTFDFKKPSK